MVMLWAVVVAFVCGRWVVSFQIVVKKISKKRGEFEVFCYPSLPCGIFSETGPFQYRLSVQMSRLDGASHVSTCNTFDVGCVESVIKWCLLPGDAVGY